MLSNIIFLMIFKCLLSRFIAAGYFQVHDALQAPPSVAGTPRTMDSSSRTQDQTQLKRRADYLHIIRPSATAIPEPQHFLPHRKRTKVCRYNWHSAGSLGGPFPTQKCKYIFQIKYTEAISSNCTQKLPLFEISKMLIAV